MNNMNCQPTFPMSPPYMELLQYILKKAIKKQQQHLDYTLYNHHLNVMKPFKIYMACVFSNDDH